MSPSYLFIHNFLTKNAVMDLQWIKETDKIVINVNYYGVNHAQKNLIFAILAFKDIFYIKINAQNSVQMERITKAKDAFLALQVVQTVIRVNKYHVKIAISLIPMINAEVVKNIKHQRIENVLSALSLIVNLVMVLVFIIAKNAKKDMKLLMGYAKTLKFIYNAHQDK